MFLVSGEAKHRAVLDWRAGKDIPARIQRMDAHALCHRAQLETRVSSSTQEPHRVRTDVVDGEAILAQHDIARGRSTVALHAENIAAIADVAMPALRHAGFYREPSTDR